MEAEEVKAMEAIKAVAEMEYEYRQETHSSGKCPAVEKLIEVYCRYYKIADEKKARAIVSEIAAKYPVE